MLLILEIIDPMLHKIKMTSWSQGMRGNRENGTASSFPVCSLWNCFWMTLSVSQKSGVAVAIREDVTFSPGSEVGEERGGKGKGEEEVGRGGEGWGWREGTSWKGNPCTIMTSSSCIYTHIYIEDGQSISHSSVKVSWRQEEALERAPLFSESLTFMDLAR